MQSDSRSDNESNRNQILPSRYKQSPERSARERYGGGSSIPIAIKIKKPANYHSTNGLREHQRTEKFHKNDSRKTLREAPSLEIGPKRLKVRGPSFLGSQ